MKRLLINVLASVIVALLLRLHKKGGERMRAVYVALIVNGRMTIDNVSKNLRDVVLEDLKALGLDGQGKPLEDVA
nr:MAG TPA: hypothetical protein [Caudoviricetes sp.]